MYYPNLFHNQLDIRLQRVMDHYSLVSCNDRNSFFNSSVDAPLEQVIINI